MDDALSYLLKMRDDSKMIEQNTLEEFFEKNSLYIGPEIMKRVKNAFKELLQQKQKEVYEYRENYQVSPEEIIKELLKDLEK